MAVTSLSIALLLGLAGSSASSPAPPSFSQVRSRRSFAYPQGQPVFYGASPGPSVDRPCYPPCRQASFPPCPSSRTPPQSLRTPSRFLRSLFRAARQTFLVFLCGPSFHPRFWDNSATLLPKSVSVLGFSTGPLRSSLRAPPHLPTSNPSPSSRASWVFIAQSHKFRVMIPHPVQWSKFCGMDQSQRRPSHSLHLYQASRRALLATSSLKEPREAILVHISVVSLSPTTKRSTAKCPSATSFHETVGLAQAIHVYRFKEAKILPDCVAPPLFSDLRLWMLALREPHTLHTENHCS